MQAIAWSRTQSAGQHYLTLVDVREVSPLEDGEPVHWRLLTTHTVTNPVQARRIVDLYRMRWSIEEFFRTLKTAGFDIEEADIGDPQVMIKFAAAATVAAVTVMQLVKAREGTTDRQLADAFEPDDQPILEALSVKLEGILPPEKPVSQRLTRLRGLGHCQARRVGRLLRQAWTENHALGFGRLPAHQVRCLPEAPRCVNRNSRRRGEVT